MWGGRERGGGGEDLMGKKGFGGVWDFMKAVVIKFTTIDPALFPNPLFRFPSSHPSPSRPSPPPPIQSPPYPRLPTFPPILPLPHHEIGLKGGGNMKKERGHRIIDVLWRDF